MNHVRLGRNILNNRHNSSRIGIWRDRRSGGGNCQVPILSVPGDVHNFLSVGPERKTSTITHRCSGIEFTTRIDPSFGCTEVCRKLFVQFELNTAIFLVNLVHFELVGRHPAECIAECHNTLQ